ncbi:hypothetical protein CHS0354_009694 [Potamilus streckersoni]|uniref:Mitochondria-eating protein n=1 Tax=Potamilus streckersoni TaxID=2493646 RepID=A0AAE0S0D0_9BIVA|nr:hypothetical protein CHS0354_009694 [Potamilus streckersoni]
MEENIKRLVSELSDIIKKLKSKYAEVEKATESLVTYVQDPNADITGMEKKVKQLEDALSLRNANKTPVNEAIKKIREALRVKKNGRSDVTDSREDKGKPPGSPALPEKVTHMKNQEAGNRPPGSPALIEKGTPVKGQGEEKKLSRSTMVQPHEIDQSGNKVTTTAEKEIRRLEAENKYLKKIMDDLHKNIIDGETKQQKEEKLPEDIRNDQAILELHGTAKKVAKKFFELEMELDFIYKRMSQFSPMIDGDKQNAGESPSSKVTVPRREPKRSPTTEKASSERAMNLDKDLERVSLAWTKMKEKERLAEYATSLLEELNNFSHTRDESNSIVLSEPPEVTSQNGGKKNLKTEDPKEKSEQSAFNKKLKRNYENACHIHSKMKEKENLCVSLEARIAQLEVSIKRLNDIQDQNTDLKKEAESLRLRLSELSGAKLSHENPDITDLSDPNRPSKLGEKYSEIYSNQWTNAFVALSKQTPEQTEDERIVYLYNILIDGYNFCKDVRRTQILSLEEIMINPAGLRGMETRGKKQKEVVSDTFAKNLSDAAKLCTNLSSKSMVRAFLTNGEKKSKYGENIKLCEAYIKECIRICWHMQVHTPPLCIDLKNLKGQKFVNDIYKEYTVRGKHIAFVVWPALYLHENGPLIAKGVAQGI